MAALVGDLVGSRRATDRDLLHARLTTVLAEVNEALDPLTPLRVTIGDDFQGGFASVGAAVRATLRLRLGLAPVAQSRYGVGWGETRLLQRRPRVEDGSAWWAARDAIEQVEHEERRRLPRRTVYRRAAGVAGPDPATLEAMLILRDQLVGDLDDRSVLLLRGLLAGRTQRELAEQLEISASAVSQRVAAGGLAAIMAADAALAQAQ